MKAVTFCTSSQPARVFVLLANRLSPLSVTNSTARHFSDCTKLSAMIIGVKAKSTE
jgi:hypothetical protein